MSRWIFIPEAMLKRIAERCNDTPFKEACGLITGADLDKKVYYAEDSFYVKNIRQKESNIDYLMEPQEQMNILKKTTIINKKADHDLVAIWHSHPLPFGVPIPSPIDVAQVSYNVIYIIYGMKEKKFRAWYFNKEENIFKEAILQVI